jgi:hypothetical protein
VRLNTRLYPAPILIMPAAIPPLPLYTFMDCTGQLYLISYYYLLLIFSRLA